MNAILTAMHLVAARENERARKTWDSCDEKTAKNTPEDVFLEVWNSCRTYSEMGAKLGITRQAVVARAQRMGLV